MKKTLLAMALLCISAFAVAQTKVIAHRGFWKTEGSAQNSIRGLVKADSINAYGSEFDVWMAADGQLVINHDPSFNGHKIEETPSIKLSTLKLKNGEHLPTLREYLSKGQELKTQLILELKFHETHERETEAVEKIVKMVDDMGLNDRVEYISFSLHAIKEFVRLAPKGTPIYYLRGELSPKELKKVGCTGPDYHFNAFRKNPGWVKECHDLGMKVNTWTVNKKEDMEYLLDLNVDFITTDEPTLLQEILANRK